MVESTVVAAIMVRALACVFLIGVSTSSVAKFLDIADCLFWYTTELLRAGNLLLKLGGGVADQVVLVGKTQVGSAKTDPVLFKWGFGEGLLKGKFAFQKAYKSPIPKRKNCLQNAHFYKQKGPLFGHQFKLDRVSFSTPDQFLLLLMSTH